MIAKEYFEYVYYGHHVKDQSGEDYVIVSDTDADTGVATAVKASSFPKFQFNKSRLRIGKNVTDEERRRLEQEIEAMEEAVDVSTCKSQENVAICDGSMKTRFLVHNFDKIVVNGDECTVIFLDPAHFRLERTTKDGKRYYSVYHIHEFGEVAERNHAIVAPIVQFG